eukprot:342837_1
MKHGMVHYGILLAEGDGRKKMKICIQITKPLVHNDNEYSVTISKIINWLEQSNINVFMFILRLNNNNKNKIFEHLKDIVSSNTNKLVVFTNKNCNINGYQEKCNAKLNVQ